MKDWNKGFLHVLDQLTDAGHYEEKTFQSIFHKIQKTENSFIFVVEDKNNGKIVGSATVIVEQKFIKKAGKVTFSKF